MFETLKFLGETEVFYTLNMNSVTVNNGTDARCATVNNRLKQY
jgi:hypothetical protein